MIKETDSALAVDSVQIVARMTDAEEEVLIEEEEIEAGVEAELLQEGIEEAQALVETDHHLVEVEAREIEIEGDQAEAHLHGGIEEIAGVLIEIESDHGVLVATRKNHQKREKSKKFFQRSMQERPVVCIYLLSGWHR